MAELLHMVAAGSDWGWEGGQGGVCCRELQQAFKC